MRTASVSLVVIALALASIVAGFLGGITTTHPPAVVSLRRQSPPPDAPQAMHLARSLDRMTDGAVVDVFSDDDVVVERPLLSATDWLPPRLTFVIGLAGQSMLVDAQFLRLGVPLAFDIDPAAPDAAALARLARGAGDAIFVHVDAPPTPAQLHHLRARLEAFDGIASRTDAGMAGALRGTGLAFFDEVGAAVRVTFARAGVTVLARDATVDNRMSSSYIDYMLARTALRSRREGRLVALMRPQPSTLRALTEFVTSSSAQIVGLR